MTQSETPMLETIDLTKTFGSFVANDRVNIRIQPGSIHALLGENGAGKSTLVKCFFGINQPESGVIKWHGEPVRIANPATARNLGIGMVFQHFSLFEALTVSENIALALPPAHSVARVERDLDAISNRYGLPLNPRAAIADLAQGERQRVEIVRCLMQDPELIILDEPTSVLTPQEAEDLFRVLEQLRNEGRAILYISHKLDEVRRLCEVATILRHGKVVATVDPTTVEKTELARMMVGESVHAARPAGLYAGSTDAVIVDNLSVPATSLFGVSLHDISFALPAGQISAIAGIAGNGQGELFSALSGEQVSARADAIRFFDQPVGHASIIERRRLHADFVSEERLGHATASDLSLSDNIFVTRARTDPGLLVRGLLQKTKALFLSDRIKTAFDVRSAAADPPARSLSGGNLQKYIIGRAVDRHPKILVINQPTWGVDAGAAAHIRRTLVDLAIAGSAILVISQDLDEIYEIADRIAVLCGGRLTDFHPADALTSEQIGLFMAGAHAHAA